MSIRCRVGQVIYPLKIIPCAVILISWLPIHQWRCGQLCNWLGFATMIFLISVIQRWHANRSRRPATEFFGVRRKATAIQRFKGAGAASPLMVKLWWLKRLSSVIKKPVLKGIFVQMADNETDSDPPNLGRCVCVYRHCAYCVCGGRSYSFKKPKSLNIKA